MSDMPGKAFLRSRAVVCASGLEQTDKGDPCGFEYIRADLAAEQIERLEKERDNWKADARASQANWHAACNDIGQMEAERRELVKAGSQARLALAGHISAQVGIDVLDRALAKINKEQSDE